MLLYSVKKSLNPNEYAASQISAMMLSYLIIGCVKFKSNHFWTNKLSKVLKWKQVFTYFLIPWQRGFRQGVTLYPGEILCNVQICIYFMLDNFFRWNNGQKCQKLLKKNGLNLLSLSPDISVKPNEICPRQYHCHGIFKSFSQNTKFDGGNNDSFQVLMLLKTNGIISMTSRQWLAAMKYVLCAGRIDGEKTVCSLVAEVVW